MVDFNSISVSEAVKPFLEIGKLGAVIVGKMKDVNNLAAKINIAVGVTLIGLAYFYWPSKTNMNVKKKNDEISDQRLLSILSIALLVLGGILTMTNYRSFSKINEFHSVFHEGVNLHIRALPIN